MISTMHSKPMFQMSFKEAQSLPSQVDHLGVATYSIHNLNGHKEQISEIALI